MKDGPFGIKLYGRPLWELIAWVIVIAIVLWAVRQEYRMAHCFDGLGDCGKTWQWDPREGDDIPTLIYRIENGNRAEGHIISRRLTMILAAGLALVIMWFFRKKPIPDIVEFIVVMVLTMGIVWFGFRYHESHFLAEITRRTDLSIQELKYQTGVSQRPNV